MPDKIALTEDEKKGSYHGSGNRLYKWMKNTTGASILHGYAVCEANDAHDEVIKPVTAALTRFAGIVHDRDQDDNDAYSIPNNQYGWILYKGPCDGFFKTTGQGAVALGESLRPVNGQYYLEKDQAAGTEAIYDRRAYALEAADNALSDKMSVTVDAR